MNSSPSLYDAIRISAGWVLISSSLKQCNLDSWNFKSLGLSTPSNISAILLAWTAYKSDSFWPTMNWWSLKNLTLFLIIFFFDFKLIKNTYWIHIPYFFQSILSLNVLLFIEPSTFKYFEV